MSQDVQGRRTTEEAVVSTPAAAAPGRPTAEGTAARARGLTKAYGSGETTVLALDSVDVDIARGRFTTVMGPSGSGKSTLMHCLAGLDTVSAGQVWIGDAEITGLKDRELTRLRRDRIGFMFQSFNLIPTLNALENITLPMDIAGRKPDEEWLDRVIDTLGLRDRLGHRPSQLSGGQQQRVACARALASRPELIFADEPTGNLDSRAGLEVLGFLREAVDSLGQTVVMVTHDPGAAAHSDLVLYLADGRIVDEMEHPTAEAVLERMRLFASTQPRTGAGAGDPGGAGGRGNAGGSGGPGVPGGSAGPDGPGALGDPGGVAGSRDPGGSGEPGGSGGSGGVDGFGGVGAGRRVDGSPRIPGSTRPPRMDAAGDRFVEDGTGTSDGDGAQAGNGAGARARGRDEPGAEDDGARARDGDGAAVEEA
ncbi:hypothetical protein GCM10010510_16610 [Streptomyces anandii JCM 4720]|nr:hypothetical protein GCM10010510_16610 [Streptomyces anandii JCM 4720]